MATEQPQQMNQRWFTSWQPPTAARYRFAFTLIVALALIRLLQGFLSRFVSLQAVLQKSGVRASSIVSRVASTSPDLVALVFVALILVLIMRGHLQVVWWLAVVYLTVETLRLLLIVVGFHLNSGLSSACWAASPSGWRYPVVQHYPLVRTLVLAH